MDRKRFQKNNKTKEPSPCLRGWLWGVALSLFCAAMVFLLITTPQWASLEDTPTTIYELEDAYEYWTIKSTERRYFVISHPPKNLDELKSIIEEYVAQYLAENGYDDERKSNIHWCFFRETSEINNKWVEGGNYFHTDYLEWHLEEATAFVFSVNGTLVYDLRQRSQGEPSEERYWIEGSDKSSTDYWEMVREIKDKRTASTTASGM